jgi:hypothetical protein
VGFSWPVPKLEADGAPPDFHALGEEINANCRLVLGRGGPADVLAVGSGLRSGE